MPRGGDLEAARRHLEAGLGNSGAFQEATGSPSVDLHRQHLLRYATLHVDHGVPRGALARDVAAEVRVTHERLAGHWWPRTEIDRFLLGVYRRVFELGSRAEQQRCATREGPGSGADTSSRADRTLGSTAEQ